MMSNGQTIAVLIANGFNEENFLQIQKSTLKSGAMVKVISPNQGLVNGWNGTSWGHNYTVDAPLNTALGVDYDALILVGGEGSHKKLGMTAHTKRFIGSFITAGKPVAAMGDSIALINEQGLMGQASSLVEGEWSDEFEGQWHDALGSLQEMAKAA